MLALLLTGLAAVAMVGGLAYGGMTSKVDSIRRARAAEHFRAAVTAYLQPYGSWEASPGKQGFDAFMHDNAQSGARRPPPDDERAPPHDQPPPRGDEG
ncbi:GGDEF domain-containing protein, partial [Duganella callida]